MSKKWLHQGISAMVLVGIAATLVVGTAFAQEQAPPERGRGPRIVIQRLAEAIGQTVEEVVNELRGGKTPAQVLTDNGEDPDTFVDALLADLEARLEEAVASGKVDQTRADQIMGRAAERLPEFLNKTFKLPPDGGDGQRPHRQPGIVRNFIGRLAETANLTNEEVVAELRAGKTPAQVLTDNGADSDAFVEELLADLEARLDEAVAAEKIDQARADRIMERAAQRLPDLMNRTFNFEGRGDGPPPGGPPGQAGQSV